MLNSKYLGFLALLCGIIGVSVSIVLDYAGRQDISSVSGMIISVTVAMIVIEIPVKATLQFWIPIALVLLLNLVLAYLLYPYPKFKPVMAAPIVLIEISAFIWYLKRF